MKEKKKLAKCPSCFEERDKTEIRTCISMLEKIDRQQLKHYKELKLDQYTYASFINSNFEWACDHCLETKMAIPAVPGSQVTPWTPHLAYVDTEHFCFSCKKEFRFRKEEKKLWYESYKLPNKAKPNHCLDCRITNNKMNAENKTISDILKKSDIEISDVEMEEVIRIYTSWDKIEKATYYHPS